MTEPSEHHNFFDKIRQNSWQHTGRFFISANIFYGLAGAITGNPIQAGAAFSGLITNGILARWGHHDQTPDADKPLSERILNPKEHPVDCVSFWNIAREAAYVAAGVTTALQRGNIVEGISLSSSGAIGATSNSIILNRQSLAGLGEKIAPDAPQTRCDHLRTKARALLEHSTNIASMLSYPGVIAMLGAGLAADNIVERTLLVSGAALDLAGITCRSLAPKTTVATTTAPTPAPPPVPKPRR